MHIMMQVTLICTLMYSLTMREFWEESRATTTNWYSEAVSLSSGPDTAMRPSFIKEVIINESYHKNDNLFQSMNYKYLYLVFCKIIPMIRSDIIIQ